MLTGRRFRVEFTDEQAAFAEQIGAVCRAVWNTGLEQRREYRRRGAWMNYGPQAKELAEAKAQHPWLAQVPGHCLQQTLMDLDAACRNQGTFRVRWRSSRRWAPSFRYPEGNKMVVAQLNGRHGRVKLPKLGWVKFRQTRSLADVLIRSATVTKEGRHWYLSLLVDDGIEAPGRPCCTGYGGRGGPGCGGGGGHQCRRAARPTIRHRGRAAPRAAAATQAVALRLGVRPTGIRPGQHWARLRARERRRRHDFCQKTAHHLVHANAVVVCEKLRVKNMTRRPQPVPDPDDAGQYLPNGAAAKSGLNKAILSKGWCRFEQALKSVSRYTGTQVVKVAAAYTSQRCSVCGHVDPKSRESQAVFRCIHCGRSGHADVNAAKNILAAGLAVTACRESAGPAGAAVITEAGTSRKPRGITAPTSV